MILQLWGSDKQYHIKRMQTIQNKILRNIAPSYAHNSYIHPDFEIDFVASEIKRFSGKHINYVNIEAIQLLDNGNLTGRLKGLSPMS